MIDLTVEHALRQLAQEAGVSRAEMIEAIVRDWRWVQLIAATHSANFSAGL